MTSASLSHVASASSPCSFVVALMPDALDASSETYTPGAMGRVDHKGLKRAFGASLTQEEVVPQGWAIESRVCALPRLDPGTSG